MKLLQVEKARSVWLFPIAELNPAGSDISSELGEWFKKRYHFSKFPSSFLETEESKKDGYVFGHGRFRYKDGTIAVALTAHSDGLIGDTVASTDATDAFLQDALEGARAELSLAYEPSMVWQKAYVSQLIVKCETDLKGFGPKLSKFEQCVNAAVGRNEFPSRRDTYRFDGMIFRADWTSAKKMPWFTFESRMNIPFSENRYYSQAPLSTSEHLALLDKLEEILAE